MLPLPTIGYIRYTVGMTSQWAQRRKLYYALGVFAFFAVIFTPIIIIALHEDPTCFDGKQNQGETAIDRGGPCQLLDTSTLRPYSVLWARAFKTRQGLYDAVAYVENSNVGAGVYEVPYQFKLYDSENILVAERYGIGSILPGGVFPVYESAIDTGTRTPTRAFFTFLDTQDWERMQNPATSISVSNVSLREGGQYVDAQAYNASTVSFKDVVFVAVAFDSAGNAITSAKTFVEKMLPNARVSVVFAWPESLSGSPAKIEVTPLVDPRH